MARNLDTSLLRAFVAVAETSGMTAAAQVLHVTQAAVSQQIKRLEENFGVQLFHRDRKGLSLTSEGERLFSKAKRMLALNDEIWAEMTGPVHTGHVRFGIPYDIVNTYLPPILKSFTKAYPQVQISLICRASANLREALAAGEIDLTLTTELTCGPDGESLAAERLVWVGARGGEAHLRRPLPVSFGSETCAFKPVIMQTLRRADIDWRPVSEISNMDAMNATVQTDLAVMALLASTVPAHMESLGRGSGLPSLATFSINLYLPSSSTNPLASALAHHVRESLITRTRAAA